MGSNLPEATAREYLQKWAAPLAGAPCGADIGFEPEFEALRAEVEKDTSLHSDQRTDWNAVLPAATDILSATSKDIWVFSYGIFALCKLGGASACAQGISVLALLLKEHWAAAFPPPDRMQRRAAPLQWLCSHLEQYAAASSFLDEEGEALNSLTAELEKLQLLLDERMGESAPAFTRICHQIKTQGAPQSVAEPIEPSEPAEPAETSAARKQPASSAQRTAKDKDSAGTERVSASALPQLVRTGVDHMRRLAVHFLSINSTDERAYTLHRAALWATLLQMPPVDKDGKTQLLCGIPINTMQSYTAGIENKSFAEILPPLERSAGQSPFWFDGHYMVAQCLEALGADAALRCVCHALAGLFERFPKLPSYSFKDGAPFASPDTLAWIESISPKQLKPKTSVRSSILDPQAERLLQEAVALYEKQDFLAGLRHLGTVAAGRSRAAIRHGLLQAEYCLAAGNAQAAISLLRGLHKKLEEWDLLDWEPEFSARILSLLLENQLKQRSNIEENMLSQLHRLHLDTALDTFYIR